MQAPALGKNGVGVSNRDSGLTAAWAPYHLPKSSQCPCFENEYRRLMDTYGFAPTSREDSLVLPSANVSVRAVATPASPSSAADRFRRTPIWPPSRSSRSRK